MKNKKYENDTVLVSKYLKGDESAFELLVKKYNTKVYSTILMIVKDKSLAEDLAQDTFIKAINKLHSGTYNEEGKFGPWLTRMAYNLAIDYFRKQKRNPESIVEDNSPIYHTLEYSEDSAEIMQERDETVRNLKVLIETLPESQKEVLKMRHYAEMSFQEIAEATGVSINTALGRMRYALINLRKKMEQTQIAYDKHLYI